MKRILRIVVSTIITISILISCKKDERQDSGWNVFPISYDNVLGKDMKLQITSGKAEMKILDQAKYQKAYEHLNRIKQNILNTGLVAYDNDFPWEVYIIEDDSTLNAFATPGGYLYFYTGIIKFFDNEAQFAGVMAHEIAHAANRHATKQMTETYSVAIVANIATALLSGSDTSSSKTVDYVKNLGLGLTSLAFSRDDEYSSDEHAVEYLYKTDYNPSSLADFFTKLESAGMTTKTPAFLSTHPNPGDRVDKINEKWQKLGGKTGELFIERYADFKSSLP